MSPTDVFDAYVLETRRLAYPGFLVESLPHFLRHTPEGPEADPTVTFANLPPGREDATIDEQIAFWLVLQKNYITNIIENHVI